MAASCSGADSRAVAAPGLSAERPAQPRLAPDAQIWRDEARGTIRLLRAANLSQSLEADPEFSALQAANRFADVALAFVTAHHALFGLERPGDELRVRSVTTDDLGLKHVRLQQGFAGLPVWGAELNVHLDRANHVYLAQGRYVRTPSRLATTPRLGTEEARRYAATAVSGAAPDCRGCRSELVIFVGADEQARLAYRVLVEVSLADAWAVMVDADRGAILDKISTVLQR